MYNKKTIYRGNPDLWLYTIIRLLLFASIEKKIEIKLKLKLLFKLTLTLIDLLTIPNGM